MNIIETAWNWNGGLSARSDTKYIALHHAAAVKCSAIDVDRWHKQNGWSGIGYHYFVCKDGTIYRGRPEWALGAHVQGMNNCSLGICAEGNYDTEDSMPNDQYNAVLDLIRDILSRYPNAVVAGHREIGSSDCPGKYYPLESIKRKIKSESECDLNMTQYNELKQSISSIRSDIDDIKNPMIYNWIDDNMPEWAREGVAYCVEHGLIQGTGDGLGLDDKDLKYCTIIMRLHKMLS